MDVLFFIKFPHFFPWGFHVVLAFLKILLEQKTREGECAVICGSPSAQTHLIHNLLFELKSKGRGHDPLCCFPAIYQNHTMGALSPPLGAI